MHATAIGKASLSLNSGVRMGLFVHADVSWFTVNWNQVGLA